MQKMQPVMMAVAKKSIADLGDAELKGKNVLIRCDLNVPLDGKTITDDTRELILCRHCMHVHAHIFVAPRYFLLSASSPEHAKWP